MREKFDIVVNLEKIAGVCALADMIDAWTKYGFRFETLTGEYHGYEQGLNFISYIENKRSTALKGYWQQVLIEMMGVEWKGQPYIIGYKPKTKIIYDIGFNYEVGSKWPVKGMAMEKWKDLENRFVFDGFTVSWQEGKSDLYEYMDWINSCRLLVSSDSLGLHLAQALGKQVVGLFGPTDHGEVYNYNGSRFVLPTVDCNLRSCLAPRCESGMYCMNTISIEQVESVTTELLRGRSV